MIPSYVVVPDNRWEDKVEFENGPVAMKAARDMAANGEETRVYRLVEHAFFARLVMPKKVAAAKKSVKDKK